MREAARFLETLSDLLEAIGGGHTEGENFALLVEAARKDVETVRLADPSAAFELGEGDVFWRGRPLAGTVDWAWRQPLLDVGVERLMPPDEATAFEAWVTRLRERIDGEGEREARRPSGTVDAAPSPDESPVLAEATLGAPPTEPTPSEPATAAATEPATVAAAEPAPPETATAGEVDWTAPPGAFSLDEEAERVWWLHGEAANRGQVPRRESEELIERLFRTLDRGPATATERSLEAFDELTTVHLLNTALLAMGLGRHLAFDDDEVRALGLAGLYHDVGRVRAREEDHGQDPASELRRATIGAHPVAGARVLMDSGGWFAVAAVVAYEHHLSWRGSGGYPPLHFARAPHQYSRIVTVCDTYDALRTERAHRAALTLEGATEYLRILAGKTLDPEIVTGFVGFIDDSATRVVHPRTRPEVTLGHMRWLPDTGFDPDFEPRPVSI